MIGIGALFTNELSIAMFPSREQAAAALEQFLDTFVAAYRSGFPPLIRSELPWYSFEFAPSYRFGTWSKSISDPSRRALALTIAVNSPSLGTEEVREAALAAGYDFFFDGTRCVGLGLAWLFSSLALSFCVEPFMRGSVPIDVTELDESGHILRHSQSAQNASEPGHIANAQNAVAATAACTLRSGDDLWKQRHLVCPNVAFCYEVEAQILRIGARDPHFVQLIKALRNLDEVAREWREGHFPMNALPHITPESGATLERFGHLRTFTCPDGVKRQFSLHGRLTPGAWRYYILETKIDGHLVFGYVGAKMPTVSDP